MTKLYLYVLFIVFLTSCTSFQAKEEGTKIDSRGNIIDTSGEPQTAKAIYARAKSALRREQYDEAAEEYRKIEANYPFSEYAEQSHIELAYSVYKLSRWDEAVSIIDRFISMNNTSQLLPYAYYLRGLTNFNRGKTFFNFALPHVQIDKDPVNLRTAFDDFSFVYKNYKKSDYVEDSYKRMIYLRNTLASYELHVANFYYKRKAFVAVVNRCNYLIEKYPNAPANIDALYFLRNSYSQLLMVDSARDIEKIIEINYPNYQSKFFQDVLDNNIKRNILALSETADDIAIGLGFDIEDQKFDDFSGVYNIEYFTNKDLIEIPRNIKPKKYTIVHKDSNKIIDIEEVVEEIKESSSTIIEYFSPDDTSDVIAKDIIVGETNIDDKLETKNGEKEEAEEIEVIESEEIRIELMDD